MRKKYYFSLELGVRSEELNRKSNHIINVIAFLLVVYHISFDVPILHAFFHNLHTVFLNNYQPYLDIDKGYFCNI